MYRDPVTGKIMITREYFFSMPREFRMALGEEADAQDLVYDDMRNDVSRWVRYSSAYRALVSCD